MIRQEYSDFAKKLIKGAAQSGGLLLINEMTHEFEIRMGWRSLTTQDAGEKAARKDELETLKSDGLIRYVSGHLYELTKTGFEVAEKL
jgi:hypothetical protein